MVHLLGLAALGGTVLIVDLGILGIGLRRQPIGRVARDLAGVFRASLLVTILSGSALVAAEAMKCYYHPAFRLKMLLFAAALLVHVLLQHQAIANTKPAWALKGIAALSLLLWLSVGLAGRAIGFL